jgi:hypothetical protein
MRGYRIETTWKGEIYRSSVFESRDLAANALPRILGTVMWEVILSSSEELPDFAIRMVEVDEPPNLHPLREERLAEYSEETERRLYEQVVADIWHPEEGAPPPYSPEQAAVTILYLAGRWLVRWKKLHIQQGTIEDRYELLRIVQGEDGIFYTEV